ncbi:Cupin_2 domain-containing protein, partial [Haematococcus lacustris]
MPSLRMSIIVAILTGVLALFLKMRVADFPRSSGRGLDHLEHNNTCGGAANIIRIVTRSADTGGKYFAFEETATRACGGMAPGLKPGSPMPHYHRAATESFKVLSGTFMYSADGKEHAAHAGETVVIPPGVTHTFWVGESDSNSTTFLVKFEPAAHEEPLGSCAGGDGVAGQGLHQGAQGEAGHGQEGGQCGVQEQYEHRSAAGGEGESSSRGGAQTPHRRGQLRDPGRPVP